uniref:Uncharacterized protein n=1 Tax=Ralstonia solanacearum TaxID=305 RepID=A0A0S4WMT1_RALSL|nr:protein of unknown function [Ralstonia solanacearum]
MSDLRGWLAVWCADAFAGWFKDLLFSLGNLLVLNYFVSVCGHQESLTRIGARTLRRQLRPGTGHLAFDCECFPHGQ